MNILLIGSGGREHSIAIKLKESSLVKNLYIMPGNAGTALVGENVSIKVDDIEQISDFALNNNIDMVVTGPEIPLCLGLADVIERRSKEKNKKIAFFGPSKKCSKLEASKDFSKKIMTGLNIPTAKYVSFTDFNLAKEYIKKLDYKFVIKADGLASGKGVILPETKEEAVVVLKEIMLDSKFGKAGQTVVIEERLEGEEVSILAFCDGKNIAVMPSSQDHKRLKDKDEGPNTGGMGAYSPAPICTNEKAEEFANLTIKPVIDKFAKEGTPYIGVLYAGLMLTKDGPRVLEYNCRFGDPETQVLMQLFNGDLAKTMIACANGNLVEALPKWKPGFAVTVVMASEGYPFYSSPKIELNKNDLKSEKNITVIHSGTIAKDSKIYTNGGRVLSITANDENLQKAVDLVYSKIKTINFPKAQYRKDIAKRGIKKQEN